MLKSKHTYILLILILSFASCKETRYVPDGTYLLKKNEIIQKGDKLEKSDLSSIIRQQPNYKRLGVKWKLMAYNLIDSTRVAEKRLYKNEKLRKKNRKKLSKQDRINSKRMDRAIKKGKSLYTEKIIPLKDTLEPRMFLGEWYKYKMGRPPVLFDSIPFNKSLNQLEAYLRSKGYYYGEVSGQVEYKPNEKCVVTYLIKTGEQYKIDSINILADNELVKTLYSKYLSGKDDHPLLNKPFEVNLLDNHRYDVAKYMRNEGLYGFSSNHISFTADTNANTMSVNMGIRFSNRLIKSKQDKDSIIEIRHMETYINHVYFHIADTINFPGSYSQKIDELGLSIYDGSFLRTFDTTYFAKVRIKKTNELDVARMAMFLHNGPLFVKPKILESKNYLEMDEKYSETKLERTYLSLLQMNLFEAVKTELVEIPGSGYTCIDAHYYLVPSKKQSFNFEPRATNSNGFLGVSASMNYVNRNLFRGAEKLTVSLSGGFESQPPIFDQSIDGEKIKTAARSFNTFEIGPSSSLELPGLFPFRLSNISKKLRPKTIISTAYNFQKRTDFTSGTFQMNYFWRFFARKTMIFQSGFPGASVAKFVNIEKSDEFEAKLNQLNDLFFLNAYSNQFAWQDWKFTFEYYNKDKEQRKGNSQLNYTSSFDPAGNIFALFKQYQDVNVNGQHEMFGLVYSQFLRFDNQLIFSKPLGKERSLNLRVDAGAGIPYGNTSTSLPYDYSFSAGGSNDNRGWRARALGPGSYQYYLDSNRTAIQIGDYRFGASAEFRFALNSLFKAAFFVDAGNVWTALPDDNRVGGQLSNNWYKEIAIATGLGLRLDLEYFIVRVDVGVPIRNPALPEAERWAFEKSRPQFEAQAELVYGDNWASRIPKLFQPTVHFGIGYPF